MHRAAPTAHVECAAAAVLDRVSALCYAHRTLTPRSSNNLVYLLQVRECSMESSPAAYLPQDRRLALARGEDLPEHTRGAALFADIAGFTPLTEALDHALGHRRGAEELTLQLNQVYTALIAEVDRHGGSAIDFAGDSLTCWFDESLVPGPLSVASADTADTLNKGQGTNDNGQRTALHAVSCALALQEAMRQFAAISLPDGATTSLALKVALACGPARRFAVGDL